MDFASKLTQYLVQAALGGALKVDNPHNFDNAFEGTTGSA